MLPAPDTEKTSPLSRSWVRGVHVYEQTVVGCVNSKARILQSTTYYLGTTCTNSTLRGNVKLQRPKRPAWLCGTHLVVLFQTM